MELNDLIPLKFRPTIGCDWVVRNNFLMYKHYEHIPVAYIENDIVYIFLDNKIQRQVLKLTKWVMKFDCEFYFVTPELSNPSGVDDLEKKNINHYLYSYAQEPFYDGFRKINFDLIKNMVDWCKKEDCIDMIKDCYDDIKKTVNRTDYDYYSNKTTWEYREDIRDDYRTLYRDIQINQIL